MKMASHLKPTSSNTLESICILLLKATFTASEALVASKSPEVKVDLRGHLEATRTSEAMKVAFRSNMHMDSRVIEVAGFVCKAFFIALSLATL